MCIRDRFDIKQEDTLEHPQHIDKTFEAIVANPPFSAQWSACLLYTSDAADERSSVDLGGRRIIKKKKN